MSLTVHKSHIAWHIATSMHKIIVRVEKHAHKTMTLNQCMNKINLQIKTVSTLRPAQDLYNYVKLTLQNLVSNSADKLFLKLLNELKHTVVGKIFQTRTAL